MSGTGFRESTIIKINGVIVAGTYSQIDEVDILTIVLSSLLPDSGINVGNVVIETLNGLETDSVTLQYYDPSKTSIGYVSPLKTYVNSLTTYTMTGTNILPNLGSPICVFTSLDTMNTEIRPLIVSQSRTSASCGEIAFSTSRAVSVNVLYYTPEFKTNNFPDVKNYYRQANFVAKTFGDQIVQVKEQAPVLKSATFDSTGAAIYTDFGIRNSS